jgi:uncharacterized protein (TIGR02001 family)
MKKVVLAAAMLTAFASQASAQEATPVHDISFNAAVVSDYRFRGISQSRLDPAIQLGADYAHTPTGIYVGTWASSIKWITDAGGDANIETNLYAGISGDTPVAGLGYDVGVLRYYYPENMLPVSANTTEVYAQLSYGPAYIKYSHATTNLFGFENSEGSGYLDIGADIGMPYGVVLNLHAGKQEVENHPASDYEDYLIGVSKDFSLGTVSLAYVDTDSAPIPSGPRGEDIAKSGVVLTLSKSF